MTTRLRSGSRRNLEPPQQRECEIGVQVPFVKLVENYRADASQLRIGSRRRVKHALSQKAKPGLRSSNVLEAHLVAHRGSDALAELLSDAPRGHAGCDPSGLQNEDSPVLKQRRRNARGFARSRRRLDDKIPAGTELGYNLRKAGIYGQCWGSRDMRWYQFAVRKERTLSEERRREQESLWTSYGGHPAATSD